MYRFKTRRWLTTFFKYYCTWFAMTSFLKDDPGPEGVKPNIVSAKVVDAKVVDVQVVIAIGSKGHSS